MKLFFDTEFTGLHQKTTLISLGIVAENGKKFYAEFTDFDHLQINEWLQKNVIDKLYLNGGDEEYEPYSELVKIKADTEEVKQALHHWLHQFTREQQVEFWSDCLAYDWVLLNGILADYTEGYPKLPHNVMYIPFDICTLFHHKGIDPDISREKYGFGEVYSEMLAKKHTALYDAEVIKACYNRLSL